MWQTIKNNLKKYNQWYDDQGKASQFWPLWSVILVGLFLITSDTGVISLLGWVYFISLAVTRWLYLKDKL